MKMSWWFLAVVLLGANGLEMPDSCGPSQFYEPGTFSCQSCPANSSMVKSLDGFSCTCEEHSIPSGGRCKPCSVTEVVSSDGTTCVPRKCQNVSSRVACRKCPNDYISVTQNLDGSATREVQCVRCARGYKPHGNTCVRCDSCTCTRAQVVVRGACVPKAYVNGRPTYAEKMLHPLELLDVVKHEYLCTKDDPRMCRTLANECVKHFYSNDLGGPCRLWLQPKLTPKGLPSLLVNDTASGNVNLSRGKGKITLAVIVFTASGGMIVINDPVKQRDCQLPLEIRIGHDFKFDCNWNLSKLSVSEINETSSPYVLDEGEYKPLPVSLIKPNGHHVQKGSWPSTLFSRYFVVHSSLSTSSNVTNTVYLKTLFIRLRLQRDSHANGSLRLQIALEAQYAVANADVVTTTLKVEHVMPSAGVARGLEVWSGVLGSCLTVYAAVQWRGALRRGGPNYCLGPLLAAAAADTLYFAALLATVHALAAEAGTLGVTLPLSRAEETVVRNYLFSAVCLKVLKVAWIHWKQCTCDVFFINWNDYNPPITKGTDISTTVSESWRATTLAREWSRLQTMRRACPGFTVAGALILLHAGIPSSQAYSWATASLAWWCSYTLVLVASWLVDRFVTSPAADFPKLCTRTGLSLMVFQEEFYAHYIHGRNDDFQEVRSMAGPLATCRVACVPKLRAVCRQLSTPASGVLGDTESRQTLLSKFLAAFFERALDGLSWVASERTLLERALNVEVTSRDGGGTSALLYDDDHTPSCFAVTWWGEEWTLSTFDAMLFSSALISTGDALLAALLTIFTWQVLKQIRGWLGNRNQVLKTGVELRFH